MKYGLNLTGFLLLFAITAFGQNNLPVIKANSRSVTIRDGLHLMKAYWYILPEKKPDIYYVEIPHKEHGVSFITDKDSISFDVKYDGEYDFIILLNNKDSCYTRIVAREKKMMTYNRGHSFATSDTIPFIIGNNSKIYFKGSINSSEPLNIQFDLGNSGGGLIKKSFIKKVKMNFDSFIKLTNSDGTNSVPFSSSNTLTIANLTWENFPFAVADNMTHREDLIAGNFLFQNKVVEINYDKKIIIIHESLPAVASTGYTSHDIILDQGVVPLITATLKIKSKTKTGWFLFDTGAYTTIFGNEDISPTNKMLVEARRMASLNSKQRKPRLAIDSYNFEDFNYTTQKQHANGISGILGNDLLKRFNVIIDNKNGVMYLKPNSLVNEPYANPEYWAVRAGAVAFLIIAMIVFIVYKRRKIK